MRKTTKIVGSIIGFLAVFVIAVIVYLTAFVNPNDFKPLIIQKVNDETGRTLVLNGDIKWTFFPWVGLQINDVSLSNAEGFGAQPFVKIQRANLIVGLLPLLNKDIQVKKLELDGLQLNLMKNAQGKTNWQDLMTLSQAKANDPANKTTEAKKNNKGNSYKFAVSDINVSNGRISWQDQQNKQNFTLDNIQMRSGKVTFSNTFPLSLMFDIASNQPGLNGNFSLDSKVNFKDETFDVSKLKASIANMQLQGQLKADKFMSDLHYNGQLDLNNFDLKKLMATLGKALPARQNPNALTRLSAKMQIQGTKNTIKLSNILAQLDSSKITGNLAIIDLAKKAMTFNFNLDQINVDNYMAAKSAQTASNNFFISSAYAAPVPANDALLPVDALRELNMQGHLHIGKLHMSKLDATDTDMKLNAQSGLINLNPITAKLYQGNYTGNISINVRGNTPQYITDTQLNNIQIEPLMQSMTNITKLQMTGVGNISTHITTYGNTQSAIVSNLNGQGKFSLNNGVLKGINLKHWIEIGKALLKRKAPPAASGPNQTDFGNMTGTYVINNGVLRNNDLLMRAPTFKANGSGVINLANQTLDYKFALQILRSNGQPEGTEIPLRITGNFASPSVQPEIQDILKSQLKGKLQEQIQEKLGPDAGRAIGNFLQQLSH